MSDGQEFPPRVLEAITFVGRTSGAVKRLGGFRKDRHTLPDAVNAATQAFFARLCTDDVAEEAESWFQRARSTLGYKRRDLSLELGPASALLTGAHFVFDLAWALNESDPACYTVTRTLRHVRDVDFALSAAADAVFAAAFSEIVFALARGVSVESVIDAVEALPDPAAMSVDYPANCSQCTITVPGVAAEARCTGATLELVFPRAGSPRELILAFGEIRAAFRFTHSEALAQLL